MSSGGEVYTRSGVPSTIGTDGCTGGSGAREATGAGQMRSAARDGGSNAGGALMGLTGLDADAGVAYGTSGCRHGEPDTRPFMPQPARAAGRAEAAA